MKRPRWKTRYVRWATVIRAPDGLLFAEVTRWGDESEPWVATVFGRRVTLTTTRWRRCDAKRWCERVLAEDGVTFTLYAADPRALTCLAG
jgi:hypothetical protein